MSRVAKCGRSTAIAERALGLVIALAIGGSRAGADGVTEWDEQACYILASATRNPLQANHMLALVQTAVYEAANAISRRYSPGDLTLEVPPGASIDAAVAAAYRSALIGLLPENVATIDSVYRASLAKIPEGPTRTAGIAVGEHAARAILSLKGTAGSSSSAAYRPLAVAGTYVPTVIPAGFQEARRPPWLLTSPWQFRPGPPPDLGGDVWARDYNEIKVMGAKDNSGRTPEQTEIARFWESTSPAIYHGVVRSVARLPGRDVTRNARLFALISQATDDALVAIMDAKHHYNFWRPFTAIRNGDIDRNDSTERDSMWMPFIETPMHPEYPCAHCIVAATVGTILKAEIGNGPAPTLTTTSPTAGGTARSWQHVEDFMKEVAEARICDGVHYRTSTEVGTEMGRRVGKLFLDRFPGRYTSGR